ncbi:hypothetical protein [Flavobacterium terrigena]|uniref:Uncharacterized protein n=1 Tax=Flavobacterium terrigena TaxID=402734 RepID=A0A1H6QJH8_9FLAO|nr:hypothetical protein [Flavobacterium terrigena]SEI39610.1 hypothetical protein SAMN05660918_0326 [Flavobacterium terrigena]
MKTINQKRELEAKITLLRSKQAEDFINLKDQYHVTIDSFKPFNLIKNTLEDVITSPNIKANLINGALSLGSNYLTKNVLNEDSKNPIKRVLGKVLKFALKNFIEKKG